MRDRAAPLAVRALVARIVDYGEADRICTLLSDERGKIDVLARGARRSRRRFGAALSLFVLGDAVVKPGRGELYQLESLESREDFAAMIGLDVVKVAHGSYLTELVRELWPAGQAEPALFELLLTALRELAEAAPSAALLRAVELKLLTLVGSMPSLARCVECGSVVASDPSIALDPDAVPPRGAAPFGFSLAKGGLICGACGAEGLPLSAALRQLLLALGRTPIGALREQRMDPALGRAARELVQAVLQYQLGKELPSWRFLSDLARG